jgi:hypothetical protein
MGNSRLEAQGKASARFTRAESLNRALSSVPATTTTLQILFFSRWNEDNHLPREKKEGKTEDLFEMK